MRSSIGSAKSGAKFGQVVQTVKTDTVTTTSTSFVDLTGMSVAITPKFASSKILVEVTVNVGNTGDGLCNFIKLLRDSTEFVGTGVGSRIACTFLSAGSQSDLNSNSITYLDSPNTTSEVTYKLQWRTESGTAYFNRASSDTNNGGAGRPISSITVTEILA